MINTKRYWENRFKTGDWEEKGGERQTLFFAKILVDNLPDCLVKDIRKNALSICDWGCAEGEGTFILSQVFDTSKVTGIDIAEAAIKKAKQKYPQLEFLAKDIDEIGEYDAIFSSNTLEHFFHPFDIAKKLSLHARKYLVFLVPFEEKEKISEHFFTFEYKNIPLSINGFNLRSFKEINTAKMPETYWYGKQILLVYEKDFDFGSITLGKLGIEPLARHIKELELTLENYNKFAPQISQMIAENQNLINQLNQVMAEKNNLIAERENLTSQLNQLASEKAHLIAERDNLINQLNQIASEKAHLITERDSLVNQLNQVIAEKQNLIAERENLTSQLNQLDSEKAHLIAERDNLINQLNQVQREKDEYVTQLNQVMAEKNNLIAERENLTSQLNQLASEKDSLVNQLNQVIAEKQNLIAERDNFFRQLDAIYRSRGWKFLRTYYVVKGHLKSFLGREKKVEITQPSSKERSMVKGQQEGQIKRVENFDGGIEHSIYAGGQSKKVSVILPVYNQADLLEESIESVLNQTYSNFELIIVNDGSTDGVERVLNRYVSHPKVKIITQENQRLPMALNHGFKLAKGEFLTWTSADNIMLPNMLERLVDFLENHKDVGMVYADYQAIDDEGNPLNDKSFRPHNQDKNDSSIMRLPRQVTFENLHDSGDNFIGPCFMYRDYVARIVGEYDPNTFGAEDYDYWMRINELFRITHLGTDEILYKYRVHGNTLNARAKELGIYENVKRLLALDKQRREWYKKPFNIKYYDVKELDLPNDVSSPKKAVIYSKDSSFLPISNKNIVYILLLDKLKETELNKPTLAMADFIIATDREAFDVAYSNYKEKLILSDRSVIEDTVSKVINSISFRKMHSRINYQGHFNVYLNRKIRVVIETKTLDRGGLEQVVYNLAKGLSKSKQFDVWIAVMEKDGYIADLARRDGINVMFFNKDISKYNDFLIKNKIDVVNTHYSQYVSKTSFKNKIVDTIHNYYIWFSDLEKQKYAEYTKDVDSIVCVSSGVADYSRKTFNFDPKKRYIILNGIGVKPNTNIHNDNCDNKVIVNIAAYTPAKAHNVLLGAVYKIKDFLFQNKVKVLCIGHTLDVKYKEDLHRYIEEKGLGDVVKLEDFIPREEIFSILQKATIFVQPSFLEGCSMALMEAVSAGLPVIVSDVGSAREIVDEDVGIIIPPPADLYSLDTSKLIELSRDFNLPATDGLAKALIEMLSNIDSWQSKRQKRIEYMKNFSLEKMVERYKEVFMK